MKRVRQFGSDNYAGVCPEVMAAINDANNSGHAPGYGRDPYTAKAEKLIQKIFNTKCQVFFVFNGTAGNCLALSAMTQSYNSIICHRFSHIENDECNAPAFFNAGVKLLTVDSPQGKLEPSALKQAILLRTDVHAPKAGAVSFTQATEVGTVYSRSEIKSLSRVAKAHKLPVHMDGARFANAVVSSGSDPADLTWASGIDVLTFGGTKNGMALGEAVVFFNPALASDFTHRIKQAGQLASKMRFLAAQWIGLLEGDTWLKNAQHANNMAQLLHQGIKRIRGLTVRFPTEANSVFVDMPQTIEKAMHARDWMFYTDVGPAGCARLMCAWDTQESDVNDFLKDLKEVVAHEATKSSAPRFDRK